MNLSWVTHPLTPVVLSGAGMIACLVLFLVLKRDFAESQARQEERFRAAEAESGRLRAALEQLQQDLREAEENNAAASRPLAGLNPNRRGQILRMHRRGERPGQIAAALGIPLNEVELLVKVHRAVIGQP